MDVKSRIQGTLSRSKDDLWAPMLYTILIIANGACPRDRDKEIKKGDRQIYRTRSGEPEVIQREYRNIPERHVRDYSRFRPNVDMYTLWMFR